MWFLLQGNDVNMCFHADLLSCQMSPKIAKQTSALTKCQRKKRLKFCKICEVINILGSARLKRETNGTELMDGSLNLQKSTRGGVIETATVSVVKRGIVLKAPPRRMADCCKGRSVLTVCVRYKVIFDKKAFSG